MDQKLFAPFAILLDQLWLNYSCLLDRILVLLINNLVRARPKWNEATDKSSVSTVEHRWNGFAKSFETNFEKGIAERGHFVFLFLKFSIGPKIK